MNSYNNDYNNYYNNDYNNHNNSQSYGMPQTSGGTNSIVLGIDPSSESSNKDILKTGRPI